MRASRTHYEILGVEPTASPAELKAAYRRLLRHAHPDMGGSSALLDLVTEAYSVLKDPLSRTNYDASLRRGETRSGRAAGAEAPQPPPQTQKPTDQAEGRNPALPYHPWAALTAVFEDLWLVFLFLMLPFAFFGHEEDPYSYTDESHISGFGWFLLLLMVPAAISIARKSWDIVRPGRWATYAWWWEAGADVAAALAPMPRPPQGAGALIGWHLARGVMTGGMSLLWHLARAGAAADKAEKRQSEWRGRCAAAQARGEGALPAALASLTALEQRYHRRRALGSAHKHSLDERLGFVAEARAHLKAVEPQGMTAMRPALVTLRVPIHRVGLVVLSLPATAGLIVVGGPVAAARLQSDHGPAHRPAAAAPPTTSTAVQPHATSASGQDPVSLSPPAPPRPPPPLTASTSRTVTGPRPTPARSVLASRRSAPLRTATPAPAPAPTCASLTGLRATYTVATKQLEAGVEKWPRVTVRNGTSYTVIPHFSGGGKASNPLTPEFPLEMEWPDYDSKPIAAGATTTFDVGKSTGLILYVPPDGKVLRFDVSLTVDDGKSRFSGCKVSLSRSS